MIQAVLDANVLASGAAGFLRPTSTPGELLRRCLAGGFQLVVSDPILVETERTLRKPYFRRVPASVRSRLLTAARAQARLVPITVSVRGVASHAEDDLVLATAVSAGADFLVTGDKRLLDLGAYRGVTILSPRAFLDRLTAPAG